MDAVAATARVMLRQALDFALPPRCPGCGSVVDDVHRFCLPCWRKLDFVADPCCARCGLPFEYDQGEGAECGACIADPPPFDRLRAAVAYGEVARTLALKLKYAGRPAVAATLAHFMRRHMPADGAALLLPVPLHRWRIWRRGYNQSALIATALARRTGASVDLDLLRRVKSTPSLRGMSRMERAKIVRGAFALAPGGKAKLADRDVVLVDDIYTSGATAAACARLLKRSGAKSVNILCWARVVGGKD